MFFDNGQQSTDKSLPSGVSIVSSLLSVVFTMEQRSVEIGCKRGANLETNRMADKLSLFV